MRRRAYGSASGRWRWTDCVLRNQGAAARSIESMPVVYARRPRPWHSLTTDVHAPTTDRERRELSICERL